MSIPDKCMAQPGRTLRLRRKQFCSTPRHPLSEWHLHALQAVYSLPKCDIHLMPGANVAMVVA
jgi:hypothetical protein